MWYLAACFFVGFVVWRLVCLGGLGWLRVACGWVFCLVGGMRLFLILDLCLGLIAFGSVCCGGFVL